MCLTIKENDKGVILKAPYLAHKGALRISLPNGNRVYKSPYRDATLPLECVITSSIRKQSTRDWIGVQSSRQKIDRGLHFSTNYRRASWHGVDVLTALLLPGSRVYYHACSKLSSYSGAEADCVTDKYVLFEDEAAALAWWDKNWRKYTK